jgi:DNA-binding NtrC family response regulator
MPQRILVADDDRVFGEAICLYLGRHGYETRWVPDAAGALGALESGGWDVLVSDISMPGNEGLELLAALKAAPYPLPVIVVTGHPTLHTAIGSVRHDAVDYLTKPLDFAQLGDAVGRAVERRRTLDAVSRAREQLDAAPCRGG